MKLKPEVEQRKRQQTPKLKEKRNAFKNDIAKGEEVKDFFFDESI